MLMCYYSSLGTTLHEYGGLKNEEDIERPAGARFLLLLTLTGCGKSGEFVIGITEYEPMNYYDENGTLIGFDTEFAEMACEKLGLTPKFVIIDWETKEFELRVKRSTVSGTADRHGGAQGRHGVHGKLSHEPPGRRHPRRGRGHLYGRGQP
jgi:hypothetical protein